MYSEQEAFEATLKYFDGDELATNVVLHKYLLRNKKGELLEKSPTDMHRRHAKEFARIEAGKFKKPLTEDEIFSYFDHFKYIVLQGSPTVAVGNPFHLMSVSNCFVLESPLDSYGGIHRTDEQLSQISKRRGGTGVDLSHLRPCGTETENSSKTSSGIVPFAERYSNSIREVGQEGRRGALMETLSVHHPQVLDFARMKLDRSKVTGANVSIRLSDEFLQAVKEGKEYEQRWPVEGTPKITKMVDARGVWNEIIKCAHEMAEPGLLFWDNILRESPADCYKDLGFRTVCTNPCGELPLCELDSCRLMLMNLYSYVEHPFENKPCGAGTQGTRFNFKKFYQHVQIAQRLMDDLVDIELEQICKIIMKLGQDPEPYGIKDVEVSLWMKIKEKCEKGRRTGLGTTGLGDTLAALGIKYGSEHSIEMVDKIYGTLKMGAYKSSVDMAEELGPFPLYDAKLEENHPFLERLKNHVSWNLLDSEYPSGKIYERMKKFGRRNIALLTQSPAGTVSIETQTTNGIEPQPFSELCYTRRKKINHNDKGSRVDFVDPSGDKWQEFTVYPGKVKEWMKITGETDLKKSPWHGCCADDLDWKQRIALQAAAQHHIDHSISSTLNLPENVAVEKVAEIYEEAWKQGLKGVTVYRKGSRTGVLVEKKNVLAKNNAPARPKSLECDVHHVSVKGKKYFVLVGLYGDNSQPYEIFAGRGNLVDNKVKKGHIVKVKTNFYKAILDDETELSPVTLGCKDNEEVVTRLASMSLRHGAAPEHVIDQLGKIDAEMTSFIKAISRALKKYVNDGTKSGMMCECGNEMIFEGGCNVCKSCGSSKCS